MTPLPLPTNQLKLSRHSTMKNQILLLSCGTVLFATSGCARLTLGDLRLESPARVESFPIHYSDLAGCTTNGLQTGARGDLTYEVVHVPVSKRITVTARGGDMPILDLIFSGASNGYTQVESRWGAAFSSDPKEQRLFGQKMDELAQSVMMKCATELANAASPKPK